MCRARNPPGRVVLRSRQPVAGQRGAGSTVGIERIGLAFEAAGGLDRPAHLDCVDTGRDDRPGQPGSVTGRPLDPDPLHLSQRGQEPDGRGVAGAGRRELLIGYCRSGHGDGGDVDGVGVGVCAGDDGRGFCQDGGVPSDLMVGGGHTGQGGQTRH